MNIPLVLTLSRILLGPLFLVVYVYYGEMGITTRTLPYFLLVLAAISELSDVFDGVLARKRNVVTDLGKLLDPMADTVFRLSVVFAFTQGVVQIPLILACVFLYREIIIGTLRTLCALKGYTLAARLAGKIKAVIQAVVCFFILILMVFHALGTLSVEKLQVMSFYAVLFGALYAVYSGVEYMVANRSYIKKALYRK